MYELRPVKIDDILAIRADVIESQRDTVNKITIEVAKKAVELGRAYTFTKNGKVVACVGEVILEQGFTDIWALYSKKFSCVTLARATVEFMKLAKLANGRIRILVDKQARYGKRYAEFLGLKLSPESGNKMFDKTRYDVYAEAELL